MSPLDDVDRVTYRLDQTFVYRYDAPIQRLRHRLRVMPPRRHGPTVLETSRLTISGADVQRRRGPGRSRQHRGPASGPSASTSTSSSPTPPR